MARKPRKEYGAKQLGGRVRNYLTSATFDLTSVFEGTGVRLSIGTPFSRQYWILRMQSSLLLGFVLMMSGAMLAYLGLIDREGWRSYFLTRTGLTTIYPAIILALIAIGIAQIVITVLAK